MTPTKKKSKSDTSGSSPVSKSYKSKFSEKFDPEQFFKKIRGVSRSGLVKMLETYMESRDANKAAGYPCEHIDESIIEIQLELSSRPVDKKGVFE